MTTLRLILESDEQREKAFILQKLKQFDCTVKETEYTKLITLDISSERKGLRAFIKEVTASVITSLYKYKFILPRLALPRDCGLAYYALIGALLSFDIDEEKNQIERCLSGISSISLKALFRFTLTKLRECWELIPVFANRLLSQCNGEDDVYELIFFLLSIDNELSPKVKLLKVEDNEILSDGVKQPIAEFTDDFYKNAIVSILKERPSDIVLDDVEHLSEDFILTIKSLSE